MHAVLVEMRPEVVVVVVVVVVGGGEAGRRALERFLILTIHHDHDVSRTSPTTDWEHCFWQ